MNSSTVIHILAGGTSRRMGSDKSALKLQNVTLLDWVVKTAGCLDCQVNVITKDLNPGKGPLAGIETGLCQYAAASMHVFLSCDMPLVSVSTLKDLLRVASDTSWIVCMEMESRRGFPLIVPASILSLVQSELKADRRSLYALFHHPKAQVFQWSRQDRMEAFNINTPSEFEAAQRWVIEHAISPPVLMRSSSLISLDQSSS